MLERMTPQQFAEKQAYYEGTGETDDQLNMAASTAMIVNELRHLRYRMELVAGNKDAKPDKHLKAEDLLRRWRTDRQITVKRQTDAQIMTLLRNNG